MLILGAFINNIVNTLIRNLDMSVRIIISAIFIVLAFLSFYFSFRSGAVKDKPRLRLGWFALCIVSMIISVLYLVI